MWFQSHIAICVNIRDLFNLLKITSDGKKKLLAHSKCSILKIRPPARNVIKNLFSFYFSTKTYVVGTQKEMQPGLSGHSKRPKLFFKMDNRLMQVQSIAECSKGSILQYF